MVVNKTCLISQIDDETHDQLFFDGEYSKSIWKVILLKNNIARPCYGLASEIDWVMTHRSRDSCPSRVYKLSLAAAIYGLWQERNRRQFQ